MNILNEIVENRRREVALQKSMTPIKALEGSDFFSRDVFSLKAGLARENSTGIIAEYKRKSPSKGIINSTSSVNDIVAGYAAEGAAGVSVLTDTQFFGGYASDLKNIRNKSFFPILRKDFIIDEYQVIESKSIGADIILLIAAILDKKQVAALAEMAASLKMEVLLEIHESPELDKISENVSIVGVNNRNLKSFETDINTSMKLADKIPAGFPKISESGISSPKDLIDLRSAGYDGFLIGELFMQTSDPVKAFISFCHATR